MTDVKALCQVICSLGTARQFESNKGVQGLAFGLLWNVYLVNLTTDKEVRIEYLRWYVFWEITYPYFAHFIVRTKLLLALNDDWNSVGFWWAWLSARTPIVATRIVITVLIAQGNWVLAWSTSTCAFRLTLAAFISTVISIVWPLSRPAPSNHFVVSVARSRSTWSIWWSYMMSTSLHWVWSTEASTVSPVSACRLISSSISIAIPFSVTVSISIPLVSFSITLLMISVLPLLWSWMVRLPRRNLIVVPMVLVSCRRTFMLSMALSSATHALRSISGIRSRSGATLLAWRRLIAGWQLVVRPARAPAGVAAPAWRLHSPLLAH